MKQLLLILIAACINFHIVYSQVSQIYRDRDRAGSRERELSERHENVLDWKRNQKNFVVPESISGKNFSSESSNGIHAPNQVDQDRDGLTDAEEMIIKTDPRKPDTDGDGLIDSWEVGKVNDIDLKAMGASPLHKDIFVEMDYMVRNNATNGLGPNRDVLLGIEEAFINSPVSNPDGKPGINIHLIPGNEISYDENLDPLFDEFAEIKRKNFDRKRAPIFHYMIWANAYESSTSSGYSMDIPHSDFIVTLGTWNDNKGGLDHEKIGTFIHELGHNLGLVHGGSEHLNYKPNHLSVMNYHFQISGVPKQKDGIMQYYHSFQPFNLPALNEESLIENDGLGNIPDLSGYYTQFFNTSSGISTVKADSAIDWNTNSIFSENVLNLDVNSDATVELLQGTPNEWAQLLFKGGIIGEFSPLKGLMSKSIQQYKRLPFVELNEQVAKRLQQKVVQ